MSIATFLVKAKIAGYATAGEGGERDVEDSGKSLSFESGEYRYRDLYYGFNPFAGEEVVWQKNEPIWTMNYYGAVTSSAIEPIEVFRFLKLPLQQVSEDRPFRGPSEFSDKDFSYFDESIGDLFSFRGKEKILFKEVEYINVAPLL